MSKILTVEEFTEKSNGMFTSLADKMNVFAKGMYEDVTEFAWENGIPIHIAVIADSEYPGLMVPAEHVFSGIIRVSIGVNSIKHYAADEVGIRFTARFDGVVHSLSIPYRRIACFFLQVAEGWLKIDMEVPAPHPGQNILIPPGEESASKEPEQKKRPTLTLVK